MHKDTYELSHGKSQCCEITPFMNCCGHLHRWIGPHNWWHYRGVPSAAAATPAAIDRKPTEPTATALPQDCIQDGTVGDRAAVAGNHNPVLVGGSAEHRGHKTAAPPSWDR